MVIDKLGVVGIGTMGTGIMELATLYGIPVVAARATHGDASVGVARVAESLEQKVALGMITREQRDESLSLIEVASDLSGLDGCPLVIETCIEDLDAKRSVLASVEASVRPGTMLATGTSALPLNEIASALLRPCRFLGVRFFHPPTSSRLVEVSVTARTAQPVREAVSTFLRALGKAPMHVGEQPGYIVHRLVYGAGGDDRPSVV